MRRLLWITMAWVASALAAHAQPFGTDLIAGEMRGPLYRVSPNGSFTTIGRYPIGSVFLHDVTLDADDRRVLVTTFSQLFAVDLATGVPAPIARISGQLTNLDENGDFIVSSQVNTAARIARVDRGAAITTVFSAGLGTGVWLADRDVTTGNWLFTTNRLDIYDYDPATASVVRTLRGPASIYYALAADPSGPYTYLMSTRLWRIDTRTGATTSLPGTFAFSYLAANSIAIDRDADPAGARLYATNYVNGLDVIQALDQQGNVVRTLGPFPGQIAGIAFDRSRNLAAVRSRGPNDRLLLLSFANATGLRYAVALSSSGCWPGVGLPDGRRIGLTIDPLTVLSAQGPIPPYLLNNVGTLGATGRAFASLNLNRLGRNVHGVRLWAVAVVLDPAAPLGIAQISSPTVIVL